MVFLLGIVVVVGLFLYNESQSGFSLQGSLHDVANQDYWSIGDTQPLSFTHIATDCRTTSSLHYKANGVWINAGEANVVSGIFNPISNELTRGANGDKVTDFQVQNQLSCNWNTSSGVDSIQVSGTEKYEIESGIAVDAIILSKTLNVNTQTILPNQKITTSVFQFSADSIESSLPFSANGKTVEIISIMEHDFDFILKSKFGSDFNIVADGTQSFLTLVAGNFHKQSEVITPPTTPPVATGHLPMVITSIQSVQSCQVTQTCSGTELINGATLDTSNGFKQLQIKGTLQDYDTRESRPQIKIFQPLNNIQYQTTITMILDRVSGDDGLFKALVFLPEDSGNGVWTVSMIHDQRQTSARTFEVVNSVVDDDPISNPQSANVFKTQTAIGYAHIFEPIINGIKQSAVRDTGCIGDCKGVDGNVLSLPKLEVFNAINFSNDCEQQDDPNTVNHKNYVPIDSQTSAMRSSCDFDLTSGSAELREIRIYPLLFPDTPEEAFTVLHVSDSSDVKANVRIDIDGKTKEIGTFNVISSPQSSASAIQCGATDINGGVDATKCLAFTKGISLGRAYIPMDNIGTEGNGIDLNLFSLGLPNKQYDMVVRADISGDFKLKTKDGSTFAGTLPQMNYQWSAIWVNPFVDDDDTCNSSDSSSCVDSCPVGTHAVVNPKTNVVVCVDDTCDLLTDCSPVPDLDTDGDGFIDLLDQCPLLSSPVNNGCPPEIDPIDTDGDGFPDVKDDCPFKHSFTNNGCPDNDPFVDTDGDGVPDHQDQCSTVFGLDGKGCPVEEPECSDNEILSTEGKCVPKPVIPIIDTDGDGVPDKNDKCPSTPKLTEVDLDGCAINQTPIVPPVECGEGTIYQILTNECVIVEGGGNGGGSICIDVTTGEQIECPPEEQYIWYIAGGLAIAGMVVFAIKRRS